MVISLPWARGAIRMQAETGSPSSRTVQVPQSPTPQVTRGPVRPDLFAQDVDEHRFGVDVDVDGATVDAQGEVHASSCVAWLRQDTLRGHRQVRDVVAERGDGVADRGRDRWHRGLAEAVDLGPRDLHDRCRMEATVQSGGDVVVGQVRVGHLAVGELQLLEQGGAQAEDHRALVLELGAVLVDDLACVGGGVEGLERDHAGLLVDVELGRAEPWCQCEDATPWPVSGSRPPSLET